MRSCNSLPSSVPADFEQMWIWILCKFPTVTKIQPTLPLLKMMLLNVKIVSRLNKVLKFNYSVLRPLVKTIPKPVYPRGRAYVYERMNVPFTFDETQTLPARYTSTFEPFHDDAGLSDDCLMQEIERFLSSVGDAIIPSGLLDQPISTAPDATNPGKSSQLRQLEVQEASHSKKMPEQRRLAQESTISNDWLEIAQSRAPDAVDVDDQSRERFVPSESLHRSWNFTEQPLLRPSDVTSASDLVGDPIDGSNGNNVGSYVEPSSSSGQDTLPYDDAVAHVSLLAQVDQYLPTSARFVPNDHLSQHAREIVPGVSSTASKAELKWFNEHRCSRTQKLQEEQSANASICREIAGWTDSTDCNDEMNELETFDSKELETLLNTLVENEKLCFIPKLASEQGENIDPHFAHQECTTLERSKGEQPRFVFPAQNPTDETTGADAESEQVESNKPTLGARSVRVSLPVEHSVQDSRVIYYESFDGSFDEGNEAFFTHEAPDLAAEDEPEIPDSALIGPRNTAVLADSTGISNHSAPEATQTPASGASGAVGAGGSGNAGTPLVTDNQDPEIPDVSSPLPPMDNNLADPRGDSGSSSSIGPYMDTPG